MHCDYGGYYVIYIYIYHSQGASIPISTRVVIKVIMVFSVKFPTYQIMQDNSAGLLGHFPESGTFSGKYYHFTENPLNRKKTLKALYYEIHFGKIY